MSEASGSESAAARAGYLIRRAGEADARAIAEAHVAGWQQTYRGLLPQEFLDGITVERRREQWERFLADPLWVVHVVTDPAGNVRGFSRVGPSSDTDADGKVGELSSIYLLSELVGHGVGSRLYDAAMEALGARYEEATLWVLGTNSRARTIYEKWGWQPDGAERRHEIDDFVAVDLRYRKRLAAPS